VLTVRFQLDGQEFLALNGGPQFTFTEAVLECPRIVYTDLDTSLCNISG
jgi:predicted 3-demethylubiquinone-9 3-methyltransferase (glyoxalase superfamily)